LNAFALNCQKKRIVRGNVKDAAPKDNAGKMEFTFRPGLIISTTRSGLEQRAGYDQS
jgi:hypothetical protein